MTRCMPVGLCQPLPEQGLWHTGLNRRQPERTINNTAEEAGKVWLWLKRGEQWGQQNATCTQVEV